MNGTAVPPRVTLAVPRLSYVSEPGQTVGVTYQVYDKGKLVGTGLPTATLLIDQTVRFTANFVPEAGHTYTIEMDANDINGNHVVHTYDLVCPGKATAKKRKG